MQITCRKETRRRGAGAPAPLRDDAGCNGVAERLHQSVRFVAPKCAEPRHAATTSGLKLLWQLTHIPAPMYVASSLGLPEMRDVDGRDRGACHDGARLAGFGGQISRRRRRDEDGPRRDARQCVAPVGARGRTDGRALDTDLRSCDCLGRATEGVRPDRPGQGTARRGGRRQDESHVHGSPAATPTACSFPSV